MLSAGEFYDILRDAVGTEYTGWKGGQFEMSETTPVWVANRGTSTGFRDYDTLHFQGVVGVREYETAIAVTTDKVKH